MTPKPYDVRTLRYVARVMSRCAKRARKKSDEYGAAGQVTTAQFHEGRMDEAEHHAWLFRGQASSISKAERAKRKRGGRK